jgi:hypothetical protein
MMFLFTRSKKIGSRLIRWALSEPVSHVAVVFDEKERENNHNGLGIVFHSTFSGGCSFDWFGSFLNTHKVVFALKPKNHFGLMSEEQVYQAIVQNFYGSKYDWRMFLEFSFYALRKKLSGKPIPQISRLGRKKEMLCTELARKITDMKPEFLSGPLPVDLITPFQLFSNLSQSPELEPVPWIASR